MKVKSTVFIFLGCLLLLSTLSSQGTVASHDPVKPGSSRQNVPQFPAPSTVPGYSAVLLASSLPAPRGLGVFPKGRDVLFNTEDDSSLYRYRYGMVSFILTTSTEPLQASRYRGGYYVGNNIGNIYKLKPEGLQSIMLAVPGWISALDVDPATGDIYFIAQGTVLFRLPKGSTIPVGLGNVPFESWGIAVRSNHLYISQYDTGLIYKMPKKGGALTVAFTGLNGPTDLVFNKEGDLFIAEYGGGSVAYIPCSFSSIKRIGWGFSEPYYIGVDLNDNVYFTDFGTYSLWLLKKK